MSYTNLEIEASGDFLKLTAGNVATFHILTRTPLKSVVHWVKGKKSNCLGNECELCIGGDKPKQRWTTEVWDRKEQKVKKLEFGSMIGGQFKAIAEMLAESQQDIHDVDIRIKTTGSNLETEYSVLHVPMTGTIPQEVTDKYLPF